MWALQPIFFPWKQAERAVANSWGVFTQTQKILEKPVSGIGPPRKKIVLIPQNLAGCVCFTELGCRWIDTHWPRLGVCVDITVVKKHILVPTIYMPATFFFSPLSSISCNFCLQTTWHNWHIGSGLQDCQLGALDQLNQLWQMWLFTRK